MRLRPERISLALGFSTGRSHSEVALKESMEAMRVKIPLRVKDELQSLNRDWCTHLLSPKPPQCSQTYLKIGLAKVRCPLQCGFPVPMRQHKLGPQDIRTWMWQFWLTSTWKHSCDRPMTVGRRGTVTTHSVLNCTEGFVWEHLEQDKCVLPSMWMLQ